MKMNTTELTDKAAELFISHGVEVFTSRKLLLGIIFVSTFTPYDLSITIILSQGGEYDLYTFKATNKQHKNLFITEKQSFEEAKTELNNFLTKYQKNYRGETK